MVQRMMDTIESGKEYVVTSNVTEPSDLVVGYVSRARRGDRSAFEAIYNRYAGRIYGLSMRMTGCREGANEVTQETFLRAWQKLPTLTESGAIGKWLQRICINLVLTLRRDSHDSPCEPETMTRLVQEKRQVSGEAERTATRMDLDKAIETLPERARMVFVLHDVYGYRHSEIAQELQIAQGTSKAQLHRARRLLREVLRYGKN